MTAQELAYKHIKSQILSCELQPGQRLVAMELAEAIGLSRTPVREALGRLEQENMVIRESGWGYVVKAMDFKDVMDLYRVREILEVEAAVEAVSFVDDVRIATLRDLLRRAGDAIETRPYSEFISQIRTFTGFIVEITGNKLLEDMISMITDRIQIVGVLMVRHNLARAKEILAENSRILEALSHRDSAAVETAMRTHVRNGRDAAARLIGAQNDKTAITRPLNAGSSKSTGSPAPRKKKTTASRVVRRVRR